MGRLLLFAAMIVCAACGGGAASAPGKAKERVAITVLRTEADGTRIVRHAGGETAVPAHPRRIAALAGTDEVLALGLKPCATVSSWGVVRPYAADALAGALAIESLYGGNEPPYEAVLSVQPDLILVSGGMMRRPQRLSAIAPTVILESDGNGGNARRTMREVAAVLGVPERAEGVIAAYEAKVAAAKELFAQRLHGESVAVIRVRAQRYQLLGGTWMGPFFYQELGLAAPTMVGKRLLGSRLSSLALDPELLPELDAQHLFVIINPQLLSDRNTAVLESVPGWTEVPAVRSGNVYYVSQSNWLVGQSLVSHGVVIDEMVSAILREGRFAAPADSVMARRARIAEVFSQRRPEIREPLIPSEASDARP